MQPLPHVIDLSAEYERVVVSNNQNLSQVYNSTRPPASHRLTAMSVKQARQKSDTTPPGSFVQPLTPPRSEQKSGTPDQQIIDEIQGHKTGRGFSISPWQRSRLPQAAYERLEKRFQTDGFVQDKLRFDYFPSANLFVLRMPSVLHEEFKSSIVDDIVQQLRSVTEGNGQASEFARRIKHGGSATITFSDSGYGRHEPDASFRHRQAQFPGVILEISYTQKRTDLARLAQDYILGSGGNIRVVVGIDIDYKDKSATLSIWQPRLQANEAGEEELLAHQTLLNQEFRDGNGEVNLGAGLQLHLEDFAPPSLSKDTKFGRDIHISSTTLCAYLHEAEQDEMSMKQMLGYAEDLKPGVKRRRLSSSSIEQLNTDDESQFQQKEQRDAKRSQRADKNYGGN